MNPSPDRNDAGILAQRGERPAREAPRPKLIAAAASVRICVQSERSADKQRAAGVTVVVGDIGDTEVIARALQGGEKANHVCPGIQRREREIGWDWIAAAERAGVRQFAFSSVLTRS